jgi:hypothetical protein
MDAMTEDVLMYDHINKRLLAILDGRKFSIPVTLQGTWHASVSTSEVARISEGRLEIEDCVAALKRYRSRNRKGLVVAVAP